MQRWIQFFGGPVIMAFLGFFLLCLVEHLEYGTHLERFRLDVLYASQGAFVFGVAWTLRNLWVLLKGNRTRKA